MKLLNLSRIIALTMIVFLISCLACSLPIWAQLPNTSNRNLAVDCVRTSDSSFYGLVLQQNPKEVVIAVDRQWLATTYPNALGKFQKEERDQLDALTQLYHGRIDTWMNQRKDKQLLIEALQLERQRIANDNAPQAVEKKLFILLTFDKKIVKHVYLNLPERKKVAAVAWHLELPNVTIRKFSDLSAAVKESKSTFEEAEANLLSQLPASGLDENQWNLRKAMMEYRILGELEFQGHDEILFQTSKAADLGAILTQLMKQSTGGSLQEIGRELGLPEFQAPKPQGDQNWQAKLTKQADAEGYRSIVVKRTISNRNQDLVTVQSLLMVKNLQNQWQIIKSFESSANGLKQSTEDLQLIQADPQVQSVLDTFKTLGLGNDSALLEVAIRKGAATKQATDEVNRKMNRIIAQNTFYLDAPFNLD